MGKVTTLSSEATEWWSSPFSGPRRSSLERPRIVDEGDLIWAEYSGGAVRHGHLVGTRDGDRLDFRYVHLDHHGVTSTGHCTSVIEECDPLRLHETWQ
ncbi:MAG: hypothetical protein Q4G46_05755 [Propionibacteriaceae bacterium]|nr:hypothetical protein [Propionibacteriaceae bacterium]